MDFFRKYFIPHKKNNYQPHLFRKAGMFSLLALVLGLFVIAVSSPLILRNTDMTALVLPRVLVDYANQDRLAVNSQGLVISPVLQKAAQMKADDMASKGYFAHKSPDGHSPWYWFLKAGYDFAYAGENLAVNFTDSTDVNSAWMNSPGHKENILNSHFTEIGIATAEGTYQGRPTTFVVQLFGTPVGSRMPVLETTKNASLFPTKKAAATTSTLSTIASTSVLGASQVNELYVAVQDTASTPVNTAKPPQQYSSWMEKILLSPNKLLSFSYLIIAFLIVGGLLLTIFIEIKKQHPYLILSALGVLIVILILLHIYQSALFAPLLII